MRTRLKRSATGPDGWSTEEVARLPEPAWQKLIHLINLADDAVNVCCQCSSPLCSGKGVPLWKRLLMATLTADLIRPIDIYSVVLRCYVFLPMQIDQVLDY